MELPLEAREYVYMLPAAAPEEGTVAEEEGEAKPKPVKKNKSKYSCLGCKINVWGKPGLKIKCGSCEKDFEERDEGEILGFWAFHIPLTNRAIFMTSFRLNINSFKASAENNSPSFKGKKCHSVLIPTFFPNLLIGLRNLLK